MGLPIGTVTVVSAGTRVALATSGNAVSAVSFKARADNGGKVFVGDDSVSSGDGYELAPGDEFTISFRESVDLRRFYVDAANNDDKVDYAGVAA